MFFQLSMIDCAPVAADSGLMKLLSFWKVSIANDDGW